MIILFLLFIPSICFSQTGVTTTIKTDALVQTTYQVLLEKAVDHVITDTGKLTALNLLLNDKTYYYGLCKANIDDITGQILLNYKTSLENDVRKKETGRNYTAYINYPKFKTGK